MESIMLQVREGQGHGRSCGAREAAGGGRGCLAAGAMLWVFYRYSLASARPGLATCFLLLVGLVG